MNDTKQKIDVLKNWEKASQAVAEEFVKKYFGETAEVYWVADEVGGVLSVNDYFFNLSTMIDFLRYKYSSKKMFEYYNYRIGLIGSNDIPINIKNYKKLK